MCALEGAAAGRRRRNLDGDNLIKRALPLSFSTLSLPAFSPPRHGVLFQLPGTVSAKSHRSIGNGARELQGRSKELTRGASEQFEPEPPPDRRPAGRAAADASKSSCCSSSIRLF